MSVVSPRRTRPAHPGGPAGPPGGGGPDGPSGGGSSGGDPSDDGSGRRAGPSLRPRPHDAGGAGAAGVISPDAIATLALTVLTVAAAVSIGRLFSTRAWVGPVLVTALGMHAISWMSRHRRWGASASLLAIVATLVLLVSWSVLPGSTHFGLPLTATWHAARQALRQAGVDFHSVTAPAPPTTGFILVTTTAVGTLAALADWAAFRMRATFESVVPSLTLFVFCCFLGSRHERSRDLALEIAALVLFVLIHQVTVNNERSAWFAGRRTGALGSAAKTGAVIGLVAILVSLNVSFRLPGALSPAAIHLRNGPGNGGGTREAPNPLVDMRVHLLNHSGTEIFTVKAATPAYWRLTSLDTFDGTEWVSEDSYSTVHHALPKSLDANLDGARVEQDYAIENLESPWLPAAYEPTRIDGVSGISYDPQSGSLITSKSTSTGLQYHVTSVLNSGQLNPSLLSSAPAVNTADSTLSRYLQLPSSRGMARVRALALQIVAGQTTEYGKAKALQDYLRSSVFTYDDTYDDPQAAGSNALTYFLFVSRRGYCQQFAGAYAVMARLLGLPTRLALGWTWGTDVGGVWHVTDDEYHTWPEVYFPQIGWVPFEPTPGRGQPGTQSYTDVAPAQAGSPTPGTTATTTPTTVSPSTAPATPKKTPNDAGGGSSSSSSSGPHTGLPATVRALLTLAAVLAALLAAAGIWMAAVAGRRRWQRTRRRRQLIGVAGAPAAQAARPRRRWPWNRRPVEDDADAVVVARAEILLAWAETEGLLAWWGCRRHPEETYLELERRANATLRMPLSVQPGANRALSELAALATKAEYAGPRLAAGEGARATEHAATIHRTLHQAASGWQRVRLAMDPRVGVGTG